MFNIFKKANSAKARYAEIEAELDAIAVRINDLGIIIQAGEKDDDARVAAKELRVALLKREEELFAEREELVNSVKSK